MKKSGILLSLSLFCFIFTSCPEKYDPPSSSFDCDITSGPAPLTVEFTSTSEGYISSYSWDFGDGNTTNTQNALHTYTSAGTFTAKLTVTGPGGSKASSKTITVSNPPPVASFTCNKTSGTVPLEVIFSSTSTGTITSQSWTFGDGGTSTSADHTHTYKSAGTYTAKLTVTGPGGEDSSEKTITVSEVAPVASFTCNKTSGTAPLEVRFTSTSTGAITSHSWIFGDGGTSTSADKTYTYNNAGTFTARLTVSGPGGSSSSTKSIRVDPPPGTSLKFYNQSFTPITIAINGSTKTIPVGSSVTFSGIQGTSADYYAYTYGKTSDGSTQIGSKVEWSKSLTLSGGTQSFNLNVSSSWFFLFITNNSAYNMQHLYVNYGLNSQTYDNIIIYKGTGKSSLGYYRAWTNSNVRIYNVGKSLVWNWSYGDNFTLPWENNQSVSISGTKKSTVSRINSNSIMPNFSDHSGSTVLQSESTVYDADNNAINLISK